MLEARDLSLSGRLDSVGARFRAGEITAICGPNGAGKSSLLACLAGLLPPDEGSVSLDGVPLASLSSVERARRIGFLPQSPEVAWDMSAQALVALGRIPWRGAAGEEGEAAVEAALAAMDLGDLRRRPVSRLSGGERARVLMARVLATRPRWLLADEPLANLDLAHAAALIARLKDQGKRGVGVVLVLHDLAFAMNHADRVIVLDQGKPAAYGAPCEALSPDVLTAVWGVAGRWLGEPGRRALSLDPPASPESPLPGASAK